MSPRGRQATVRFYFDADVLGLAKLLVQIRPDVTFPGDPGGTVHRRARPPSPITSTAVPDSEWIPEVSRRGWMIVTRDSRIQDHRSEIAAVRESDARMVALAGRDALGVWDQLEVVMTQWRAIERLLDDEGPFIYRVTRTALRRVALS